MECRFGPLLRGVHRRGTVDHVVVDAVLGEGGPGAVPQKLRVAVVVADQHGRSGRGGEPACAQRRVLGDNGAVLDVDPRTCRSDLPRPGIAEPQGGEDMQRRWIGAGVAGADAHHHVLGARLGVLRGDLPVAVVVEDAGVEQLELRLVTVAAGVLVDQLPVGEGGLRVVVEPAHPGVRRRRVEVPPVLLDILAVVALRVGEPEGALLEDGVLAVPERQREDTGAARCRRCRRARPRSIDTRASARGRAGSCSRRRRRRCSPRAPCPRRAR